MSTARDRGTSARRWRAPRRLRITTAGRVFLALTVGIGVGALNTGNNLLYLVLGLQLATIVVSGLLSERCLGHLEVERVRGEGLAAGEPSALAYRVVTGRASVFALSLAEEGLDASEAAQLAYLAANGVATVRRGFTPARRGPIPLTAVIATTLYPLALFAKSRRFELPEVAWAQPRRRAAPAIDAPGAEVAGDVLRSARGGGGGDLLDLRELHPHEDARRVHWLKSATAGRPLHVIREQEQERTVELSVPSAPEPEALDPACEATAALARRYLQEGYAVGLTTDGGRLDPAAGPVQAHRILELLARAGYGSTP